MELDEKELEKVTAGYPKNIPDDPMTNISGELADDELTMEELEKIEAGYNPERSEEVMQAYNEIAAQHSDELTESELDMIFGGEEGRGGR